jgi:hypothetical protein
LALIAAICITWFTPAIIWKWSSSSVYTISPTSNAESIEAFSSQFGFTATILSGFAFASTILAIRLQGQQLNEQRRNEFCQWEKERKARKQKDKQDKRERVLHLIDEWNDMVGEKIVATAAFDDPRNGEVNICDLEHNLYHHTADAEANNETKAVMKVIRFIEKWKNMEDAKLLDVKLMDEILPVDLNWWGSHFLTKLVADQEELFYDKTVNRIKDHFQNLKMRDRIAKTCIKKAAKRTEVQLDELDKIGDKYIVGYSKVDKDMKFVHQWFGDTKRFFFINVSDRQSLSWCLICFLLFTDNDKFPINDNSRKNFLEFFETKLKEYATDDSQKFRHKLTLVDHLPGNIIETVPVASPTPPLKGQFKVDTGELNGWMLALGKSNVESWGDLAIIIVFSLCFRINVCIVSCTCCGKEKVETVTISGDASLLKKTYANVTSLPVNDDWEEKKMVYIYFKHSHYHLLYPKPRPPNREPHSNISNQTEQCKT